MRGDLSPPDTTQNLTSRRAMGKVRDRAWGYPNSGVVRKGLSRRGNTYVVVLGLEAILAIAFAAVFLQEAVSVPQLCGAALVVLGVAILELSD